MFKSIEPKNFSKNIFNMIGEEYLLISANDNEGNNNIMTASWGTAGILWNKPILQIFVRPQRYTHNFLKNGNKFAICVFDDNFKKQVHSVCGLKSGRDTDKIKETGITPIKENGYTYFKEATTVFLCETLYSQQLNKESILEKEVESFYNEDYHTFFIGEITEILIK